MEVRSTCIHLIFFLAAQLPPHLKNSEIIKYALLTLIDNGECGVSGFRVSGVRVRVRVRG